MQKLKVNLEHCYGIEQLSYEFDFSTKKRFIIYAANGTMKTSFANTFERLSKGLSPEERVHGNASVCSVTDDHDVPLRPEEIFVIVPIDPEFKSEKMSTLLVKKELKDRYDAIRTVLETKKTDLIKALKTLSDLPINAVEATVAKDIAFNESDFYGAMERLRPNVTAKRKSKLGPVLYQSIFEERVVKLIESSDFQSKISQYMKDYEDLISGSRFFKLGIFNHDNAEEIADALAKNGFFEARHSINMMARAGTDREPPIETKDKLVQVIRDEKRRILSDPKLTQTFDSINLKFTKNESTRNFRRLLESNPALIAELTNLPQLRDKLWTDYLIERTEIYNDFMTVYDQTKDEIQRIFQEAREEETEWRKVLSVFRTRFSVPFDATIENQVDAMLHEKAPALSFTHTGKSLKTDDLWKCLSMGERRALYLLNIIFEVRARKELSHKTLYVIDDIADSFDYKNKYAIVEYLCEMSEFENSYLLLFTHNFDFYRTLVSRFDVGENKAFVEKVTNGLKIIKDKYWSSPFLKWQEQMTENNEMLVATIPFVRNVAEFCGHHDIFDALTQFLHFKPDTHTKTVADLQDLFNKVLANPVALRDSGTSVKSLIYSLAEAIITDPAEVVSLEKKIVLSIAIRMKAEEFMVGKIEDDAFWRAIQKNQTVKLIKKFKAKFANDPAQKEALGVLTDVNLMTPESIHVNSFMYEPLLDMSGWHLQELYRRVGRLR